MAPRL